VVWNDRKKDGYTLTASAGRRTKLKARLHLVSRKRGERKKEKGKRLLEFRTISRRREKGGHDVLRSEFEGERGAAHPMHAGGGKKRE